MYNFELEVNIENFKNNLNTIQEYIGSNVQIMAIIKDHAYGSYLDKQPELFENCPILGVSNSAEGIALRKNGWVKDIFILNQPFPDEISAASEYNLSLGVASIPFLNKIIESKRKIKIHLEVETGMERTGINTNDIPAFISILRSSPNINLEGMYTHFAGSDSSKEYTLKQLSMFNLAAKTVTESYPGLKYIHAANSSAMILYPETHFNLVRPGIALYGYHHNRKIEKSLPLNPVLKLKSRIAFVKTVPAGTSIGYNSTFITKRKSKIATVYLGYADGIRRALSNKGKVVINNQLAPIVGTICMDSFMVDITDINADLYDEVYIWDNENVTLSDISKICNTVICDITSTISPKVHRHYIDSL